MNGKQLPYDPVEPDDIELGEEITDVEMRQPAGMVVSVRLSAKEAQQLQEIARESGKSLSAVARESLQATIARGIPVVHEQK